MSFSQHNCHECSRLTLAAERVSKQIGLMIADGATDDDLDDCDCELHDIRKQLILHRSSPVCKLNKK